MERCSSIDKSAKFLYTLKQLPKTHIKYLTMDFQINKKIQKFFEDRPEVLAVYLFGSYIKSRENKDSDIDLAVLIDHQSICRSSEIIKEYTVGLARALRKDFHIIVMNRAGEELLAQIFKNGSCILIRNERANSTFKMVKHAMIAEFSYYRDLMKKGFLRQIGGGE
jgi:predicted nucleotidyltransferase